MTSNTRWLSLCVVAACGGGGSGGGADAAHDSTPVPTTITISGVASERSLGGTTLVAGLAVAAYKSSDETTAVAMATTDAMGKYTLTITTNGQPLDGFVKATKSIYMDTYLYAPAPLTADFTKGSINMLTPSNFNLLQGTLCNANQTSAMGTIAVIAMDASMTALAGATVASTPAATKYCYDMGGFPNKNATMTDTDGVAIMFNVTGSATVTATKSGATFKSHVVNARAGAFTTTVITE